MNRHTIISKEYEFYKNFIHSTVSQIFRSHLTKQNLPPQVTFETIKLRTLRDTLDKFDLTLENCDSLINICEELKLTPIKLRTLLDKMAIFDLNLEGIDILPEIDDWEYYYYLTPIKLRKFRHMFDKFNLEDCFLLLHVWETFNLTRDYIAHLRSDNKIYIHPDCSEELYKYLHVIKFTPEEFQIVNHFFSRDDHDEKDVILFADILDKYKSLKYNLGKTLDKIFAVDGFSKHLQYKYYIKNLKYKFEDEYISIRICTYAKPIDYEFIHVKAVRYLYENWELSPFTVYETLVNLLDSQKAKTFYMDKYLSFAGHLYENLLKIIEQKKLLELELEINKCIPNNKNEEQEQKKEQKQKEECFDNDDKRNELKVGEETTATTTTTTTAATTSKALDDIKKQ